MEKDNPVQTAKDDFQLMIDKFQNLHGEKYSDPSYVYSYSSESTYHGPDSLWIEVFKKLPDTQTNENTTNYINPEFALYCADKLFLVAKYNPLDLSKNVLETNTNSVAIGFDSLASNKNTNSVAIGSDSLVRNKFYRKRFSAVLHGLFWVAPIQSKINGFHIKFYDDGRFESCGRRIEGKKTGIWKGYFPNGTLEWERKYEDRKVINFTSYFLNSDIVRFKVYYDWTNIKRLEIENYPDGKRMRISILRPIFEKMCYDQTEIKIEWNNNGKLKYFYIRGDELCRHVTWNADGTKEITKNIDPLKI